MSSFSIPSDAMKKGAEAPEVHLQPRIAIDTARDPAMMK